jgi:hypothetical protein
VAHAATHAAWALRDHDHIHGDWARPAAVCGEALADGRGKWEFPTSGRMGNM